MENLNSARAVVKAAEREEREREAQRKEREFDKNVSLAVLNELKVQNAQLKKEYDESQIELKKSKKYNRIMLVVALGSAAVAIASLIVAIVK